MNIILTGLRGSGKTSIGQRLAELLSRPFIDTDTLIKAEAGMSIQEFVAQKGWEAFRDLEHEITRRIATCQDVVISTGGGLLVFERNRRLLKPSGIVVLLYASPAILARRVEQQEGYGDRPPLTDQKSLVEEFQAIWQEREPLYRKVSDLIFPVEEETSDFRQDIERKARQLQAVLAPYL
ncbi:MAG: shikimate kinase [Nitrospinota bacterium]|nr:MAG: shikimate kinase [Nitrospinota bacterium]